MNLLKSISLKAFKNNRANTTAKKASIYDVKINTLQGDPLNLNDLKGKFILLVNVASKCGFTKQYKDLENLHKTYHKKLVVIGLPCNQFGAQEPGSAAQIQSFCEVNFGVTFTLTEKVMVKGEKQHPLYQWLTQKRKNGFKSSSVKWNFQKYLISPKGELLDFFYATTNPNSKKITAYLN